jgi:heme-degrading monooxygenase HmoA
MITEHAVLTIIPGQESAFEAAFAQARPLILGMPGVIDLSLSRSFETPNQYLLLVAWKTLEDHTVGFRGSPVYEQWRHLLHHFYQPMPTVEHFTDITFSP